MRIPVVREWGSWAVFFSSVFAGLIAGLLMRPWQYGRDFFLLTVSTILGLTLLINAKNPLAALLRSQGRRDHLVWFCLFFLAGLLLLVPVLYRGIGHFAPFSVLIASYTILLFRGREHDFFTELNGFALLTLPAPMVSYAVTGFVSWPLYMAVTIFFAAGVFKVRMRLRKTAFFRWLMVIYCLLAVLVYGLIGAPVLLLLPLGENIITAIRMQEEKLKTTGDTELIKGIVFLVLMFFFWR